MTVAVGIVLILVGAAIAAWALVGRRIGTEPRCSRCAFDLSGHGEGLATCPECGTALGPTTIVRGVRRRRWLIATLALVAVAFGATISIDVASVARLKLTPTWWLVHVERHLTTPAWRRQINEELTERVVLGSASVAELSPILDDLRERQRRAHDAVARGETPTEPWERDDTLFVVLAFQAGGMADDDFANFVLDATDVRATAEPALAAGAIRPRLVVESPRGLPAEFNAGPMLGGLTIATVDLAIAERTIPLGGSSIGGLLPRRLSTGPTELKLGLPPGPQEGTLRATLTVGSVTRTVERTFVADVLAQDRVIDYAAIERELAANLSPIEVRVTDGAVQGARAQFMRLRATWSQSRVRPPDSIVAVVDGRRYPSNGAMFTTDGTKATVLEWDVSVSGGGVVSGSTVEVEFPWVSIEPPGIDGFVGTLSTRPITVRAAVVP